MCVFSQYLPALYFLFLCKSTLCKLVANSDTHFRVLQVKIVYAQWCVVHVGCEAD